VAVSRTVASNENICSVRNQPSKDPRDLLVKAAMRDAVMLGSILEGEFRSTYDGPHKAAYLAALRSWLADLGVAIEDGEAGAVAAFADRRIVIRFGRRRG
jgi:hypothetical protein